MAEVIFYDPNGATYVEMETLKKQLKEKALPERTIAAAHAGVLFRLIEKSPELLLVIVTNSKNTTPYGESAQTQRSEVIAQLEEKGIPYTAPEDGEILTQAVLNALASKFRKT